MGIFSRLDVDMKEEVSCLQCSGAGEEKFSTGDVVDCWMCRGKGVMPTEVAGSMLEDLLHAQEAERR